MPGTIPALLPPSQLARVSTDSVIFCSCCGNLEVHLGGRTFLIHPMELLLLLDWLDTLSDAANPPRRNFVFYRPEIRVGPRTISVRTRDLERLRSLVEGTLEVLDHSFGPSADSASFRISLSDLITH